MQSGLTEVSMARVISNYKGNSDYCDILILVFELLRLFRDFVRLIVMASLIVIYVFMFYTRMIRNISPHSTL